MNLTTILLVLLTACAQINSQERAHFEAQNKLRHGIVPRDRNVSVKVLQQKLDEASVMRGKMIYRKDCLSCHGESGEGNGPEASKQKVAPANLLKTVAEVRDFDFYIAVSEWAGAMPGWKKRYSDPDLEDLTNYLKSFSP